MYRTILFSLLFLLLASASLLAQNGYKEKAFYQMGYIAWDINIPVNNDFVTKTSYAGGSIGYRKMLKSGNISVGFDVSWASYYEYTPRKTYQLENGAITTDFYRYIYTLPMSVNTHYYFKGGSFVHPFIGIGIGATYGNEQLYYNTYVSEDDQWGFLVRPEVGAIIKFQPGADWGILAAARYSYSTNKQSDFDINSLTSIGFQLGLAWSW